jgi:hypothetical protein
MQQEQFLSILTGLAGLGLMWLIILIATGKHFWVLAIGEDGRPSTSKLQMLIWTSAVVFAFLALFQIRFGAGFRDGIPNVSDNVLIAMGISIVTAVSAKSIAVNSASNNASNSGSGAAANAGPDPGTAAAVPPPDAAAVPPPQLPAAAAPPSKSGIFCDDQGNPDLGKVQLMLWTLIAVSVFLADVFALIKDPTCPLAGGAPCVPSNIGKIGLPDIGQTMMILMGLGSGAYLGKKIAES